MRLQNLLIILLLIPIAYAGIDADHPDLLAYYKFDVDGTDALNASNVTSGNVSIISDGKINGAVNFSDHRNNCLVIKNNTNPTGSISLWINVSDKIENFDRIFIADKNSTNRFQIRYKGGAINFYAQKDSSDQVNQDVSINNNTWYHYVVTWETDNVTIYLNGIKMARDTKFSMPDVNISNNTIGCLQQPGSMFDGVIDELSFWKKVLSPDEVWDLYLYNKGLQYPFNPGEVNATVDYSSVNKSINMYYGAQDKETEVYFLNDTVDQQDYLDLGTDYKRIWVQESYRNDMINTIPLLDDCITYDYTNLTNITNQTLQLGIIPYISFSYAPDCMSNGTGDYGNEGTLPNSYKNFSYYVGNITLWFYNMCDNGTLSCGDFNKWRFEIWNEVHNGSWYLGGRNRYAELYNVSYHRLKRIVPDAYIGAGSVKREISGKNLTNFYDNLTNGDYPDFIGLHIYDKVAKSDSGLSRYDFVAWGNVLNITKELYLQNISNYIDLITSYRSDTEVWNGEYNMDSTWSPRTHNYIKTQEGSAWLALALHWQVLTEIESDMNFERTGDEFGLTYANNTITPPYNVKTNWTSRFTNNSNYYTSTKTDDYVEVASTDNDIVVINKINKSLTVNLNLTNKGTVNYVIDEANTRHDASGGLIPIDVDPFDVKFLRMANISLTYEVKSKEACNDLVGLIGDAFSLSVIVLIILVAGATVTVLQLSVNDVNLVTLFTVIIFSAITFLLGYFIVAYVSGAIC